jgi:hypothetical protein
MPRPRRTPAMPSCATRRRHDPSPASGLAGGRMKADFRFAPPPLPRQFILPFKPQDEGTLEVQPMTRNEIEDLQRLIRQREKVLKSAAKQRAAEVLADFENQMGQKYSFDDDHVWAESTKIANAAVAKAQEQIKARCREIGIPDQFAPSLQIGWQSRNSSVAVKERRAELRKMAVTAIEAQEQKAKTQIELSCLKAQENLALAGLATDVARGFIESLPSVEELMPRLSFAEVSGESSPPVAERLLNSNALRQQRHRERQKALRNATEPLRVADITGSNGGGVTGGNGRGEP